MNNEILKLVDMLLKDNPEMDFLSALDEARAIYNKETNYNGIKEESDD